MKSEAVNRGNAVHLNNRRAVFISLPDNRSQSSSFCYNAPVPLLLSMAAGEPHLKTGGAEPMSNGRYDLDMLCVNTLRTLAIDAIQKANSGHPGLPLGAAPMAYVLWQKHLKHNPANPLWPDRDRFVLSAGHGSSLLYALLHLTGYDLSLDDLKQFRQLGSLTPGHPEFGLTAGVDATTGPLGQGCSNAVGMAIAESFLANMFNRAGHTLVNHHTYALLGDGDVMEGVAHEAGSLAGHLKLGRLIYLYDSNDVTLDGPASLTFTEDVEARYRSYGWQVMTVEDGDRDLAALDEALTRAKADSDRPSLIIVKTTIGFGSPNKQGTCASHGSPLGFEEIALTKEALGVESEVPFFVPKEASANFRTALDRGAGFQRTWDTAFETYAAEYPELAEQWRMAWSGELPEGWDAGIPAWGAGEKAPTRAAGGKVLNAIASNVPWLLGGDADLSCSTKTALTGEGSFEGRTGKGRNIHYGVREHAMAAIANGLAYHGGTRNYTATFFCFSDYMRPAIRLAAMNGLDPVYVFSHDSVAVGEDGPTHQAVEQLMALRVIPNLAVIRPADPNETAEAWRFAMKNTSRPTVLVLTRQDVPALEGPGLASPAGLHRGAYVLKDPRGALPAAIIIATGSEVHLASDAAEQLAAERIPVRVVSMPSWDLFEAQPEEYRETVLPSHIKARVSIEAGVTLGWKRWVGDAGVCLGIDRFGISAPAGQVMEYLGMTAQSVAQAVRKVLAP